MKIFVASIFVDDQQKALEFYTGVLGFVKKADIPLGEFRWLTVVSPGTPPGPDGMELLLEPNENAAAKTYQQAIFDQGIPATTFSTENLGEEVERLTRLGAVFTAKPAASGAGAVAVFNDTCGNLI